MSQEPPKFCRTLSASAMFWIATALLVLFLVLCRIRFSGGVMPMGDGRTFEQLALNLVRHHTYTWGDGNEWAKKTQVPKQRRPLEPCADYEPLHPAVLSFLITAAGGSYVLVGLANAIWLAAGGLFVLLIARRLGPDPCIPVLALALYVGSVPLYANLTTFYREPLYTCLIMATAWGLVEGARRPDSLRWLFVGGVCWGLSILCKSVLLLFVPVYPILSVLARPAGESAWRAATRSLGTAAIALAVIAPWTLRNLAQGIGPVLVASQGGINFMCTVGRGSGNESWRLYASGGGVAFQPTQDEQATLSEGQLDHLVYRRKAAYLLSHPSLALKILAKNAALLLYFIDSTNGKVHVPYLIAFPFFWIGVMGILRKQLPAGKEGWVLLGLLGAYAFGLLVHISSPGYRAPIEPVSWPIAAWGMARVNGARSLASVTRKFAFWGIYLGACAIFSLAYTPSVRTGLARAFHTALD